MTATVLSLLQDFLLSVEEANLQRRRRGVSTKIAR
jgi:hypothetical protein